PGSCLTNRPYHSVALVRVSRTGLTIPPPWFVSHEPALPFRHAAVLIAPYRVVPVVAGLCPFDHVFLVDLYSQPRAIRNLDEAAFIFKYASVRQIVEEVVGLVVVDAEALLLDECVMAGGVHLQAGRQRDGAQRAMRRRGHIEGLGHGDDLFAFGDAARV